LENRESNCDIKFEKLSNYQYEARIRHLKIEHEEIILQNYSLEDLKESVLQKEEILNQIYYFNQSQQSKINKILDLKIEKKELFLDWDLVEKRRMVTHKIFSTPYITYNQVSGKPEAYFPIDNPTQSTIDKPSEPFPPIFFKNILKDRRQKRYEQKKQIYKENKKRVFKISEEQNKWKEEYPHIVKNLKENYMQGDKNAIEIYSKLVLDILEFNIDFTKKYSLEFNLEEKYLIVNYSIIDVKEIFILLKDKIYNKSYGEQLELVDNHELIKRLNYIWSQIILKVIYVLYQADEINIINFIHFNGKILVDDEIFELGEEKYETEITVSKEQFVDTFLKAKKIYTNDRIKEFNRDLFFINKLKLEGIYLYNYAKIDSSYYISSGKSITYIVIDGQKKLTSKIFKIISNFSELKKLHIINNPTFHNIPLELFSLISLEEISFSHTQIKSIPNEISSLKRLKKINLSYNKITEINQSITLLPYLKELDLDGNQINNISLDILTKLLKMKLISFSLFKNPIFIGNDDLYNEELITKLIGDQKGLHINNEVILKKPKKKSISKSQNLDFSSLIITEGKTDWKHLKKALEKFQMLGQYKNLNIKFDEYKDRGAGEAYLENQLKSYASHKQEKKIIGIFDRDTKAYVRDYGKQEFVKILDKDYKNRLKEKIEKYYSDKSSPKYKSFEQNLESGNYSEIEEDIKKALTGREYQEWKKLSENNVYAFCIPEIQDSDSSRELDAICIEFYYQERDLQRTTQDGKRLFFADEFEFNKEHSDKSERFISKCGKFTTESAKVKKGATKELTLISTPVYDDKKQNVLLLKNDFTNHIINDVEGFDNFDIENFKLIFDVIEKIIRDV